MLRRLREVMAEPVSAQERLDKIVVLIGRQHGGGGVFRLRAARGQYARALLGEGLNREAVHQTVLRQDEGLVGLVASEANPINLSEAQNHPAFRSGRKPAEEIYHPFLGVLRAARAGNTLGVLVVRRTARGGAPIRRKRKRRCRRPPWCWPRGDRPRATSPRSSARARLSRQRGGCSTSPARR